MGKQFGKSESTPAVMQWYGELFNNSLDGLYRTTPDGKYIDVNPALVEMLGYSSKEELFQIDITTDLYVSPEDRPAPNNRDRRFVTRLRKKDGTLIWAEITSWVIRDKDGNPLYYEGIMRDITEKEETQKKLQTTRKQLEMLHRAAVEIARCENEGQVYQHTIRAAEEILDFPICVIGVKEGERVVTRAVSRGIPETGVREEDPEGSLAVKTIRTGRSYLVRDLTSYKEALPAHEDYRSVISTPIGDIGYFQAASFEKGAFDEEDLKLVEILTSHTNEAVRRIRSREELRYFSFHDELTGLYNRAYFRQEMERLDTPRQYPISLIYGDVNALGLVNDAFGHSKGDELLKRIGKIIKNSCREEDIVCRWGGDEFIILLPQTERKDAEGVIGRIKEACIKSEEDPIRPSISLGIGMKKEEDQELYILLQSAEDAMYRNKMKESTKIKQMIIDSLNRRLLEKDYESSAHIRSLTRICHEFGRFLSLSQEELNKLSLLAEAHDLGKLTVSKKILNKEGSLSPEEWEVIKRHPGVGYRIAISLPELSPVADAILSHHERWDGEGYPQGLSGSEIPFFSRLLALVEAYDVLTRFRPYREAVSHGEALEEIKEEAGSQFDPQLTEKFIKFCRKTDFLGGREK